MVKSASKTTKSNVIADIKVPVPSLTVETQTKVDTPRAWSGYLVNPVQDKQNVKCVITKQRDNKNWANQNQQKKLAQ